MVKITKTGVSGDCVQKDDNTWICYRGTRQIAAIRLQSIGVLIACRSACIFNFAEDTYASIFHCRPDNFIMSSAKGTMRGVYEISENSIKKLEV